MSKAIEDLIHEHDAILSALQTLEKMARTENFDAIDAHAFIGFLKEFVDKCHHGKEEDILFPALLQAENPEIRDLIDILLAEHAEGRRLVKEMEDSISGPNHNLKFGMAVGQYQELLRNHTAKENNDLFPLAANLLNGDQLKRIYERFEEHEEKVIGQGRHEELHQILEELGAKYAA